MSFAAVTAPGSNDCYCSRLQWIDIMKPIAIGNSLFRRKIPCSVIGISLFLEEQGIRCKLLSPLGDWLSKPPEEVGIVRNFRKFPVLFPVLRDCADQGPPTMTHRITPPR